MSYFDSPKNRAIWEKQMVGLREERARREKEGYNPEEKQEEKTASGDTPFRRQINLAELEQIERDALGIKVVRRPSRQHQASMNMAPQKEQDNVLKGRSV